MSEQKNQPWKLAPYTAHSSPARVQVAGKQLAIASHLDQEIERRRFVAFLQHLQAKDAVVIMSRNQPLQWEQIERFRECLSWTMLSKNESLPWSAELIERYRDRWDWKLLTRNNAVPWSDEFIEKFANHRDKNGNDHFFELSKSVVISWSAELIARFVDRWNWCELSKNGALPWSLELIDQFAERWDWGALSNNAALPWSLQLIENYAKRWSLYALTRNEALPWSVELIERYEDQLKFGFGFSFIYFANLSGNEVLPWSLELIERYKDCWSVDILEFDDDDDVDRIYPPKYSRKKWNRLSSNRALPWSFELIEQFEERWNWSELAKNEALPWSLQLIERYEDRWDADMAPHYSIESSNWTWNRLSANEALPWSLELIERFKERWNWSKLSNNAALPWSLQLIESYAKLWSFDALSSNEALPWSVDLIKRFETRWDWSMLSKNGSLPWSIELIASYPDRWDWERLSEVNALPIPTLRPADISEVMGHYFTGFDPRVSSLIDGGNLILDLKAPIVPGVSAAGIRIGQSIGDVLAVALPISIVKADDNAVFDFGIVALWVTEQKVTQVGVFKGYHGALNGGVGIGSTLSEIQSSLGQIVGDRDGNLMVEDVPGWCFDADHVMGLCLTEQSDARASAIYVQQDSDQQ